MVIADCDIDRPRRHRVNPRVVKVKMSNYKRKNKNHKSEYQDTFLSAKLSAATIWRTQTRTDQKHRWRFLA